MVKNYPEYFITLFNCTGEKYTRSSWKKSIHINHTFSF